MKPRILYVSEFPLSGSLSPSINEMDFALALEARYGAAVHFHICDGPVEVPLPTDRITFFLPPPPISKPLKFVRYSVEWAREVKALFYRHHADLVVIRTRGAPLAGWLLARSLPKHVFAKSVGRYWIEGPYMNLKDHVLRALHRWFCEGFFHACAGVEAVTEGYRDIAVQNGISRERCFVVSNSVSLERFRPNGDDQSPVEIPIDAFPVIGYAGSWPDKRGGHEIIELVKRLCADYPRVFGVVAGRSTEFESLRRRACDLGVENQTALPGWIPFGQLAPLVRRFDVGINFIPDAFLVGGNASMKVRQYIASGVLVITHDHSNEFIACNDLGSLVTEGDLDALEDEVRKWVLRLQQDRTGTRNRLYEYARKNLSTVNALKLRESYWLRLSGLENRSVDSNNI